jgi:hypothetical protein
MAGTGMLVMFHDQHISGSALSQTCYPLVNNSGEHFVAVYPYVCWLGVSMMGVVSVRVWMQLHLAVTNSQTKLQGVAIKTLLSKLLPPPVSFSNPLPHDLSPPLLLPCLLP